MSLFGWIFRSRRRRPVSWRLRSSTNNKNHHHHNHQSNQQEQQQKTQKRNSDMIIIDNDHTPPPPNTTTSKPVAGTDNYSRTKSNESLIHPDINNNETINNYNNENLLFQCIQTALLAPPVPSPCYRRGSRQPRPRSTIIKNTTSTLHPVPTKRWSTGMLFVDFEEFDHFYDSSEKQKQSLQTPSIRPLHSSSLLSMNIITSNTTADKLYVDQFNNHDDNNNNNNNNNNNKATTAIGRVTSPQLPATPRNPSAGQRRRSSRVQSIPPTCGYHFLNSIPEIVEHNNSIAAASQKPSSSTPFPPLNLT